jgi:uncharacterized membrane protein
MDDIAIARALHVLAAVLWIGGVAFVTAVLFPAIRGFKAPEERLALFDRIERRFASQATFWVAAGGASGFYMVLRLDLWSRFLEAGYW